MSLTRRNDRPSLVAELNFNLPSVERARRVELPDAVLTIRMKGKKRKNSRHSIDFSGLAQRLNADFDEMIWRPETASIGNDNSKNLFVVFDKKIPEQSVALAIVEKDWRVMLNSKAVVAKVMICLRQHEVPNPTLPDTGIVVEFDMEKINNDDTLWRLVPKKMIQEFQDETVPNKVKLL